MCGDCLNPELRGTPRAKGPLKPPKPLKDCPSNGIASNLGKSSSRDLLESVYAVWAIVKTPERGIIQWSIYEII